MNEDYYDSLEEDEGDDWSSNKKSDGILNDLTVSVPLYRGETPKEKIINVTKKNVEKIAKPVNLVNANKIKKSYLSMYYEKMNRMEVKNSVNTGSNTSRAVCDLSPRRDSDLDLTTISSSSCECDSDHDDFYEKFLAMEIENKQSSASLTLSEDSKTKSKNSRLSCSQSAIFLKPVSGRQFSLRSCVRDNGEKLELLRKRQNYGINASMKNRIKIEEIKSLKKIKNSNLGRYS